MADGRLNQCKSCKREYALKYRDENLEKVLEYDRQRGDLPHRVKARREYVRTEQGKEAKRRALGAYIERYPGKAKAHYSVSNAVRDGRLVRPSSCSECSSTYKVEAHHDDYSKPLDVRWLCEPCHKTWHKFNEPKYEKEPPAANEPSFLIGEGGLDSRLEWGPHCGYPRVIYDDPVDEFHATAEPFLVGVGTPYESFVEPYVYAEMRHKV